jgi:hypothetical protein
LRSQFFKSWFEPFSKTSIGDIIFLGGLVKPMKREARKIETSFEISLWHDLV